jgi:hypothetical protein
VGRCGKRLPSPQPPLIERLAELVRKIEQSTNEQKTEDAPRVRRLAAAVCPS